MAKINMDDFKAKWNWSSKSTNSGNFWSDLDASRAESDLSFFSNGTSPQPQKVDALVNSNFTSYKQWSGPPFSQYSLWGSPPPTPGLETAGSRPQTQMSNLTGSSSRSGSPEWNGLGNDSFNEPRWREETRHGSNNVMCTYDSSVHGNPWSHIPIGTSSQSLNPFASTWFPTSMVNYDQRNHQPLIGYDPKINAGENSFALDKLAERFQEFKLKPQILSKRISDRKIKANLRKPACIECVFCKNNEESENVYKSHVLKDVYGRIQCPVLRLYRCPICGNPGGDQAHTIRYCPKSKAHLRKLEGLNCKKEKRRGDA